MVERFLKWILLYLILRRMAMLPMENGDLWRKYAVCDRDWCGRFKLFEFVWRRFLFSTSPFSTTMNRPGAIWMISMSSVRLPRATLNPNSSSISVRLFSQPRLIAISPSLRSDLNKIATKNWQHWNSVACSPVRSAGRMEQIMWTQQSHWYRQYWNKQLEKYCHWSPKRVVFITGTLALPFRIRNTCRREMEARRRGAGVGCGGSAWRLDNGQHTSFLQICCLYSAII